MEQRKYETAVVHPVTAVNGYGAAWSLGREGIPVIGLSPLAHSPISHSSMLRGYHRVPDENNDPDGLVDSLVELGRRSSSRMMLFMLTDLSAFIASTNRERLEPYYTYPWMNWDLVLKTLDRKPMFDAAVAAGVPLPRTWFSDDQHWSGLDLETLPYPVMLKPMVSRFCFDGRKVENAWTFTSKHGKAIEVHSREEFARTMPQLVADNTPVCVQERLDCRIDDLWAHHFYAVDGEIVADFTGHKLHQVPHDFGTGTICRAAPNPDIVAYSRDFVAEIGFSGIGNIEYIRTDDGYRFVEINPRGYYWSSLATACGVNLYKIMYDHLNGAEIRPGQFPQLERKLLWFDAAFLLDYFKCREKRIGLGEFLMSPKMEAVGGREDFKLALRRYRRLASNQLWGSARQALRARLHRDADSHPKSGAVG